MSLLSVVALIVFIGIHTCIRLEIPFFNLTTNKTETKTGSFKCNKEAETDSFKCDTESGRDLKNSGWKQTFLAWKSKENIWIAKLKNHLDHLNFHVEILKRKYEELTNVTNELRLVDKKTSLGNPFSLFALLKRSAKDWPKVALLMYSLPGDLSSIGFNTTLSRLYSRYKAYLPRIEDLSTGYRGIARLQRVYNLSTDSLADQKSITKESLFSASDSLEFAKYFCTEAQGRTCDEWLKKVSEKNIDTSTDEFLQLAFLSRCLNGNQTSANIYFQELIERKSTFNFLSDVCKDTNITLERILHHGCEKVSKELEDFRRSPKTLNKHTADNERFIPWTNLNQNDTSLLELCRYPAVYNVTARLLKCRYVHYNKPQLMIGPFKVEEFHIDPPILLFHDVISDGEISEMIDYGRKIMTKANVHFLNGSESIVVNQRSNELGWIKDKDLPLSKTLSERAARITNWRLEMAEVNQIACYAPGGEFRPHVDALPEESFALTPDFADYSVLMFYISDVTAGGHTIFPALNVSLVPQKGSAALWFNRKPDGSVDYASLHGGCPVLEGHKWVINKWFHIQAQDFPNCTKKNNSFRYFYV